VHRYFFIRDSPIFADMFALPVPDDEPAHGISEDYPIAMDGVEGEDFDRLLSIFYPLSVSSPSVSSSHDNGLTILHRDFFTPEITSLSSFISLASLALRFDFNSIRLSCLQQISLLSIPPVDKILLGRLHCLPEWLESGYVELCVRNEAVSLDEGGRLGLGDVLEVGVIRDSIRFKANLRETQERIREMVEEMIVGPKRRRQCVDCHRAAAISMGNATGASTNANMYGYRAIGTVSNSDPSSLSDHDCESSYDPVPDWLLPKYTKLITRSEPLTYDEVVKMKLSLRDVILVGRIRESVRYKNNFNRTKDTICALVRIVFVR
jgi:hypothetical protein